jgi:hypothetical protein
VKLVNILLFALTGLTAAKRGVRITSDEVYRYASYAVTEYLRTLIENCSKAAYHRSNTYKDDFPLKITSTVQEQLKAIEVREQQTEAKLKENKHSEPMQIDSKPEPPANPVSSTNATALQAIGDIRVKKPEPAPTPSPTPPKPTPPPFQLTPQMIREFKMLTEREKLGLPKEQQDRLLTLKKMIAQYSAWSKAQQATLPHRPLTKTIIVKDLFYSQRLRPELIEKWEIIRRRVCTILFTF